MAGIGEWNVLSAAEIRDAFDKAKGEGKDYLVKVSYTSQGRPMGMAGIPVLLDMIDFHEAAYGVGAASAVDDLRAIYRACGTLNIQEVYELRGAFDQAAKGNEGLLPQAALETVRGQIAQERHDAAMAARPWWKKLFGMEP